MVRVMDLSIIQTMRSLEYTGQTVAVDPIKGVTLVNDDENCHILSFL